MDAFIKWTDKLPLVVKVIFAIFIDVYWYVYRFFKSFLAKNTLHMVLAVVFCVFLGWLSWIVDAILLAINKKIPWFEE